MAALLNAVKLTGRRLEDLNVLIIGLGAAGIAVTKILLAAGVRKIIGADSRGALHVQREDYLDGSMNEVKRWFAEVDQPRVPLGRARRRDRRRRPADRGLRRARAAGGGAGADERATRWCSRWPTPTPRSTPRRRRPTCGSWPPGRSDYPNQINNVLCFPGIFRGALDVRAPAITEEMKMAAARAIAAIVDEQELREDYIIPSVFNRDVAPAVAAAVAEQARAAGTALAGQEVGFAQGDTVTGAAARRPATGGRDGVARVSATARDRHRSDRPDRPAARRARCASAARRSPSSRATPSVRARALGERRGGRAGTC